MVQSAIVSQCH